MRKNIFKRRLGILLTAALTAGLCACGITASDGSGSSGQNSELGKQYVYSYNEFELPDLGDDTSIMAASYIEGTIYVVEAIYNYSSEADNEYRLIHLSTDGNVTADIELEPVSLEEEAAEADAAADTEASDAEDDLSYEYCNYYYFVIMDDGAVYAVRNYYKEDYSDEENPVYINEYGMCRWNTDGAIMEYYPLDEAIGDDGWI
ncbi:MAG: hypothetical protein LUG83_11030, partial [Lachnospiraceae bacterium]|nr:hypothetical protein [Lachnospiraceae bacterium]